MVVEKEVAAVPKTPKKPEPEKQDPLNKFKNLRSKLYQFIISN